MPPAAEHPIPTRITVGRLLRRAVLWHAVGIPCGALGLGIGIGYALAARLESGNGEDGVALILYLSVAGLLVFTVLTPVGVPLLALWSYLAARIPRLEPARVSHRLLRFSVVAIILTVQLAISCVMVLGFDSTRDGRSGVMAVTAMFFRDWPIFFAFLPGALGWFVAPRFLAPSLWAPPAGWVGKQSDQLAGGGGSSSAMVR